MLFGHNDVLKIEKKADAIIWEVKPEPGKNYEIQIEDGLQGIVFRNGVKGESIYATGAKTIFKKNEGTLKIVVVNRTIEVPVRCGCGDVPFTDYEIDYETKVGMNGICKIKIINPNQFANLFVTETIVTKETIEDYFRKNFSKVLAMALAAGLKNHGKEIEKELYTMGLPIKEYLNQNLGQFGIEVVEFNVLGIKFSDDYLEARTLYFEKKKARREERKEQQRIREEQDRELDALERISKMNNNKKEEKQDFIYCGLCGFKNEAGTQFCKKCGNKLN